VKDGKCLYLTYEGLKLKMGIIKNPAALEFVSYLWGIETKQAEKSLSNRLKFVSYLWGIETDVFMPEPARYIFVCILPMRDWNLG